MTELAPSKPGSPQHGVDSRGRSIGQLKTELRGDLDWIVMKALEKDRRRRYQSARELGEDLQRYLNNEAVEACPPSVLYRALKIRQSAPCNSDGVFVDCDLRLSVV